MHIPSSLSPSDSATAIHEVVLTSSEDGGGPPVVYRIPLHGRTKTNPSPVSHLLIATRAANVVPTIQKVQSMLARDTVIVLLGNGLCGVLDEWGALGNSNSSVVVGSVTHGVYQREQEGSMDRPPSNSFTTRVHHAGFGRIKLSPLRDDDDQAHAAALALARDLHTLHAEVVPGGAVLLWQKLIVNAAINPITVARDCLNGSLLEEEELRQASQSLCREALAVARCHLGLSFSDDFWMEVETVLRDTRHNVSSSLAEARRGGVSRDASELHYLNGFVVKVAKRHGLPSAVNEMWLGEALERYHNL